MPIKQVLTALDEQEIKLGTPSAAPDFFALPPFPPRKLQHGGLTFHVEVLEQPRSSNDEKCYGTCDFNKRIIELEGNRPSDAEATTLLHELLHVLFSKAGDCKPQDEEQVVRMMAAGIMDWFLQNPSLINYLSAVVRYCSNEPTTNKENHQ